MRVLSRPDLKTLKGIPFSNTWLLELEREGKFPRRIHLGERRHGWLESEIDAWIEARAAKRATGMSPFKAETENPRQGKPEASNIC